MRYKPERALTRMDQYMRNTDDPHVEMSYKPERALTLQIPYRNKICEANAVEMRYKPERALTHGFSEVSNVHLFNRRNEV